MTDSVSQATPDAYADMMRGFDKHIGLQMRELGPDRVVADLTVTPELHQPFGVVHGGVYCSIIESVASFSGFLWLQHTGQGGHCVGVNNNTDFLRSIREGTVTATSTPIHRGRSQQLWLVEIVDESGRMIARGQVRLHNLAPAARG